MSIDQTSLRNSSAFEGQNPRTVLQEIHEIFQDNSKNKEILNDVLSWANTFEVISIQKKKTTDLLKFDKSKILSTPPPPPLFLINSKKGDIG